MPTRPSSPIPAPQAIAARNTSLAQLRGTLPELITAEAALAAAAAREGIIYRIADFGGLRSEAQTTLILKYRDADYRAAVKADPRVLSIPITRWRRIAPYGQSRHDIGAAFDVDVQTWPASMSRGQALGRLATLAPSCGLDNGARFQDLPHMQLPDAFAILKARYLAMVHSTAAKVGVGAGAVVASVAALILLTRMR